MNFNRNSILFSFLLLTSVVSFSHKEGCRCSHSHSHVKKSDTEKLLDAVRDNDIATVKILLAKGVNASSINRDGLSDEMINLLDSYKKDKK